MPPKIGGGGAGERGRESAAPPSAQQSRRWEGSAEASAREMYYLGGLTSPPLLAPVSNRPHTLSFPAILFSQVLPFDKSTRVAAMVPVSDFGAAPARTRGAAAAAASLSTDQGTTAAAAGAGPATGERDVVMLSRQGQIKRVSLRQFAAINRAGLGVMGLRVRLPGWQPCGGGASQGARLPLVAPS